MHQLRFDSGQAGPSKDAILAACVRVSAIAIGKRKQIIGIEIIGMMAIGAGWHRKAHIEHAIATAGDNRDCALENTAAIEVRVEAVVNELPQQAPALGHAISDGMTDCREFEFSHSLGVCAISNG